MQRQFTAAGNHALTKRTCTNLTGSLIEKNETACMMVFMAQTRAIAKVFCVNLQVGLQHKETCHCMVKKEMLLY